MQIRTEKEKWSDFKERILPNLEALLQFSLGLAVNGRDAVGLLREALAGAYLSWDKLPTEAGCRMQVEKIMTRRFLSGIGRHVRPLVPAAYGGEKSLAGNGLIPAATDISGRGLSPSAGAGNGNGYSDAIAGLPEAFRSAMILSYLEGFSNSEIARLAGVPPNAIDTLLARGREIIREELFAYLMGNGSLGTAGDGAPVKG